MACLAWLNQGFIACCQIQKTGYVITSNQHFRSEIIVLLVCNQPGQAQLCLKLSTSCCFSASSKPRVAASNFSVVSSREFSI